MRQGRELEDYVANRWTEETGKKVHRVSAMLYNRKYPFAHADVDRMVVGENAGLECKTTSTLDLKQFKSGEFPEKYYVQCVHYIAVTGAERWYLAVLVFGRGFYTYTLERDQDEIDALMEAEKSFWQYVETNTPPPIDGSSASSETLKALYGNSRAISVDLFGREMLLSEYLKLKQAGKVLETRITEIENVIKADMGNADNGQCSGYAVSWKSQTRRVFQIKDFQLAHPEIDISPYYKTTTLRPFKVAERISMEEAG